MKGFEEVLNYTFNDTEVLLEALTHDNSIRIMNYQRLEVIGDAALGKLSNFFCRNELTMLTALVYHQFFWVLFIF
jgi:hypothetical protein